ncbi:MAG: KH domain-containing protein [Candidatus Pacebacteria bacterium]|nr:KH domain-containing protein [Candidatus Paceibacterota bacterium]
MQENDKEFLEYVVKALVDNPNDVKIDRTVDEMGVLISLSVNPADMGKIIGRMGNTAKAIRTLLRIIGMKNNARVNLKINEPEGSTRPESPSMSHTPTMKTVDQAMEDLKGI